MPKRPTKKRTRLTDDIDTRLTSHIQQIRKEDKDGDITSSAVFEYVQNVDFRFKRMKKLQLEKSIDRVLKTLKNQKIDDQHEDSSIAGDGESRKTKLGSHESEVENVESSDIASENDDSVAMEFEGLEPNQLMEVKDTNFMNNSITKIWSQYRPLPTESSKSTPSTTTNSTTITTPNTSNVEMREKIDLALKTKGVTTKSGSRKSKEVTDVHNTTALPTARLSDLGGVDSCIEEVLELIAMPLSHPEIYLHTGVQPPRGILLHGPPGCGKTLLANAIAGELRIQFISISAPSIVSGMSGESEKKIREIFDEAKVCVGYIRYWFVSVEHVNEKAPCLIFIDEIDAITPKRETAQREMERRIVAQLLTCMDGIADLSWEKTDNRPILIIGATNRPDSLDPALRRAGRFDREISMGVPDEQAREKILKVIASRLKLSGDFNYKTLAKLTPGYVGADLNALTTAAGVLAVKRIFTQLGEASSFTKVDGEDSSGMSVDERSSHANTLRDSFTPFENQSPTDQMRSISNFLKNHPEPLTSEELEPLSITNEDFLQALSKVQPSSKREGFATVPDVTWTDIGALKFVRDELRMAIVEPIKHPEFFRRVGIVAPSGVLLWGPPGCGKTLLAKAVANESHTNFISVKGPELLNKYVGESERGVRQVFARARASSPCIIFFDELDALCARRDDSQSEASARVVNTLLTELDGLESRKQVYVMAATNRPDIIDPAVMRPGRLDKLLFVELPTASERIEILKTLTKLTPLGDDVSLENIALDPRCTDFSGADLASLVREAAVAALRATLYSENQELSEQDIYVNSKHFEMAFDKVTSSVSKADKRKYDLLRARFGCATGNKVAGHVAEGA
ncbi:15005_t:CDS:10 [Acaulospora colombiana]|uniref:15005_t:CDS:1 n=1 Tax=Acaulospora colombiana TaxID=27376 RepID=A0ACA9LNV7_9GLOM|nr:15005_t:CDS:10 [Acaulospora colombiana]